MQVLDVSYNLLNDTAMIALSFLPSLRNLNMNNNNLELIPPEATETGAFVRLETLSAAGNNLSSTCLVALSKVLANWALVLLHPYFYITIWSLIQSLQRCLMIKCFSVQLPWLETLNLHKNHIKTIPDQVHMRCPPLITQGPGASWKECCVQYAFGTPKAT